MKFGWIQIKQIDKTGRNLRINRFTDACFGSLWRHRVEICWSTWVVRLLLLSFFNINSNLYEVEKDYKNYEIYFIKLNNIFHDQIGTIFFLPHLPCCINHTRLSNNIQNAFATIEIQYNCHTPRQTLFRNIPPSKNTGCTSTASPL